MKYLITRMRYNTFIRLKAIFPATKNETMASYFNRLAVHLEMADKYGYLRVARYNGRQEDESK